MSWLKKGSGRQRDWQGRLQLRVSVLSRVATGGVLGPQGGGTLGAVAGGDARHWSRRAVAGFPGSRQIQLLGHLICAQCHHLGMAVLAWE